jgi:hypothetical protein
MENHNVNQAYIKFLGFVELNSVNFIRNFVPARVIESPYAIELRIRRLRREKFKLAVDSEIVLLTVIDNMNEYQLEQVMQSCFLICLQTILPNKYIEPHKDPDVEATILRILESNNSFE